MKNDTAAIEAIIFAYGEPISIQLLAQAAKLSVEETVSLVAKLERRYNVSESGLEVLRLGEKVQMATREEFAPLIKNAMENRRQQPISAAGMETLAIIAYNQPVTKSFVEEIRGIDSSSVVTTLVEKDLLEEAGRLDLPGRPVTYRTTDTFLRSFGLSSLADLPPIPRSDGQLLFADIENSDKLFATDDDTESFSKEDSDA